MPKMDLRQQRLRLERIQYLTEKLEVTHHQPKRDQINEELHLLRKGVDFNAIRVQLERDVLPYGKGMV